MKQLRPGEERFVTKKIDKFWRVYDKVWGSFPYQRKELGGTVVQDVPEDEAKLECERLNKQFVNTLPVKEKPAAAKKAKPQPEPYKTKKQLEAEETIEPDSFTPAVELTEDEIPDYGLMSEEDRKKFEEGTVL